MTGVCARVWTRMNEELTAMSVKISAIQEEIAERKKFIDSIPVQLKAIEKVRTAALLIH